MDVTLRGRQAHIDYKDIEMKKWGVYVYGDVNIDEIIKEAKEIPPPGQEREVDTIKTCIGGGAALFAMGIGKLGLRTVFKGSVGNDLYGEYIKDTFKKLNIDTSLITTENGKNTGISLSFTDKKDRSFLTYRGTNDYIDIKNIKLDEVKLAGHIHITGYMGSKNHNDYYNLIKRIKEDTDTTVSFDVGWDDSNEWNSSIYDIFPYLDVLFMNEIEALHYSGKPDALEAAGDFSKYTRVAVLKLGANGALAVSDGKTYMEKGFNVTVMDTTGAGDSFNAGFIYGYLTSRDINTALRYGNGCGALSCTGLGGNTAFPDIALLKGFIEKR